MTARILVADDDASLQRLIFHTLKLEGYEVISAHDGKEALEIANRDHPDLIILDIMMPHINGIDVCRILREQPSTATLPIILLSGLTEVQEKVLGLKAGADEYITKPIDLRELAARVDALLKRNRLLRASAVRKAGKIITFLGAKGGVGVTTVALNAAALLAGRKKTVIVAEIRPDNGTCAAQLNVTPTRNLAELLGFEAPAITEAIVAGSLYSTNFGVRVLFGPQTVDQFQPLEPARVAAVLDRLAHLADYVVVDLPAMMTLAHEVVVKNSRQIFLLVEPELSAVASAAVRLAQLEAWDVAGSVIHPMIVNRQGTMLISLREIERRLGKAIEGVAPPATEVLGVAVQYGMPIVLYQPEHVMAANLEDMLTRLIEKPSTLPQQR
jgi:DNA-binding response OmpR family regulator